MGKRTVLCGDVTEVNCPNREEWLTQGWVPGEPVPLDTGIGEESFAHEIELCDRWDRYDDGRVKVVFGPVAADFVSTELLFRAQTEALKRGTSIHLHVAQDEQEQKATLKRSGLRAIPYLDWIGLLAQDLMIAAGSPLPLPAWQVLRMATVEGADALGIGDRVGSLEEGKEADLILIDLTRPTMAPVILEPAQNIVPDQVYAETGSNVRLTMIAGRTIYEAGAFANIDRKSVMSDVAVAVGHFQTDVAADRAVSSPPIGEPTWRGLIGHHDA